MMNIPIVKSFIVALKKISRIFPIRQNVNNSVSYNYIPLKKRNNVSDMIHGCFSRIDNYTTSFFYDRRHAFAPNGCKNAIIVFVFFPITKS